MATIANLNVAMTATTTGFQQGLDQATTRLRAFTAETITMAATADAAFARGMEAASARLGRWSAGAGSVMSPIEGAAALKIMEARAASTAGGFAKLGHSARSAASILSRLGTLAPGISRALSGLASAFIGFGLPVAIIAGLIGKLVAVRRELTSQKKLFEELREPADIFRWTMERIAEKNIAKALAAQNAELERRNALFEEFDAKVRRGAEIVREFESPVADIARRMDELDALLARNFIDPETFRRAREALQAELFDVTRKPQQLYSDAGLRQAEAAARKAQVIRSRMSRMSRQPRDVPAAEPERGGFAVIDLAREKLDITVDKSQRTAGQQLGQQRLTNQHLKGIKATLDRGLVATTVP